MKIISILNCDKILESMVSLYSPQMINIVNQLSNRFQPTQNPKPVFYEHFLLFQKAKQDEDSGIRKGGAITRKTHGTLRRRFKRITNKAFGRRRRNSRRN